MGLDMELGHLTLEEPNHELALSRLVALRASCRRARAHLSSSKCLLALLEVSPIERRLHLARRLVDETGTVSSFRRLGSIERRLGREHDAGTTFLRMQKLAGRLGDLDGLEDAESAIRSMAGSHGSANRETSFRAKVSAAVHAGVHDRAGAYREIAHLMERARRRRARQTVLLCQYGLVSAAAAASDIGASERAATDLVTLESSSWSFTARGFVLEHAKKDDLACAAYVRAAQLARRYGDRHHDYHACLGLARLGGLSHLPEAKQRALGTSAMKMFRRPLPLTHLRQVLCLYWFDVHGVGR
jgi:hypothetical protein